MLIHEDKAVAKFGKLEFQITPHILVVHDCESPHTYLTVDGLNASKFTRGVRTKYWNLNVESNEVDVDLDVELSSIYVNSVLTECIVE